MSSFISRTGAVALSAAALAVPATATAYAAHKATTINVPCSSAALVTAVNTANTAGTATLRLSRNCTYSLTAAAAANDGLPIITGNVTLLGGPSTTIRRDPAAATAFRVLEVATGGTLRIDGIFLLDGAPAAGVPGAGIENAGTLRLTSVTVSGNTTNAANGGGLDNTATGHALVSRTVFSADVAGLASGGAINNSGVLTLSESRLSGNSATAGAGGGGGLTTQVGGTSRVVQSTFDHNTTAGSGGGLFNAGTTSLLRTLVELNSATVNGGGILNLPPGTVTLQTSIVRANTPNNCFPLGGIAGCVA